MYINISFIVLSLKNLERNYNNEYRIYADRGKFIPQFRLLIRTLFVGKFAHPVGGNGVKGMDDGGIFILAS